jgi:hypothetical protein
MVRFAVLAGGIALWLLPAMPALADEPDCTPRLLSQMPLIAEPDGRYAVDVHIDGAAHRMLLATTDIHTMLFRDFVAAADLKQRELPERKNFYTFGGKAEGIATVDTLSIAGSNANGVQALVTRGAYRDDAEVVGTLGADLLSNFDVDFDFKGGKFNLYESNLCDGKPVYWPGHTIDLAFGGDEGFGVPMTLDGKDLLVTFDTLTPHARMRFDVANELFGLSESSAGIEPRGTDEEDRPRFKYTFGTLTAPGLSLAKPVVLLHGRSTDDHCDNKRHSRGGPVLGMHSFHTCYSDGDMQIGLKDLNATHLYIAYKAKRLYFAIAN